MNIVLYFAGAGLISLLMFLVNNKKLNFLLFIPFIALQSVFTIHEAAHLNEVEGEYFRTDRIGLIFLVVLTIISTATAIHSAIYSYQRKDGKREIAIHNSALVVFITMMTGVLISYHVGMIWAFLEATTLTAALLIYHDRVPASLEASWKYVFVCSIGIALAFVGILFLSIGFLHVEQDLTIGSLTKYVYSMDPTWLKLSFLFVVVGFSVKMGFAPLFMVDIDAKDVAPSPISALFSGGLLNVGFVAVFRFYEIFATTSIHAWMNKILIIIALASIFFAAVYLLKVKNYKRMFAYSSLEHAGIALLALAAGGIGYFAVILHLVLHAFVKASLFYQIGQVYRVYKGKTFDHVGGYFKANPTGSAVMLMGFTSIMAIPPSGLFLSEFLTFKALIQKGHVIIIIVTLALLCFILFAMAKGFLRLLFAPLEGLAKTYEKINPLESITQWVLLLAVFYMGVNPPVAITDFIKKAVEHLPN